MDFKESVSADNAEVFLNLGEFADVHDVNGTECDAILQQVDTAEALSTGSGENQTYLGLYGRGLVVNCLAGALPEIPVYGEHFSVDGKYYFVDDVKEDMGMLTIRLIANDR